MERRNEIVECLEMDRVREAEENESINMHLNMYTLKKEVERLPPCDKSQKKEKKKLKKFKLKGTKTDETKSPETTPVKDKEKKKKKFNISVL